MYYEEGLSRRRFVQTTAMAAAGIWTASQSPSQKLPRVKPPPRPHRPTRKLALITTAYYYLSHAYHIGGRFLSGYVRQGRFHFPDCGIASMYVEQQKGGDLSAELAARHEITIYPDVAGALMLGGNRLSVDGVLLIGEHGDYPYNDKGQKLYPRFELFEQIVQVFRRCGRAVPVFCDKHLSYDRSKARQMAAAARELGFPLMAGSSLPITWRRPELELPIGVPIRDALVASRGELEIFGFHALEALQCMVERRVNGMQGVRAVTCLEGDAVWKAADEGIWSWNLLEEALSRSPSRNVGDIRENCRHFRPASGNPKYYLSPVAFIVEYLDGLRATALLINGHVDDTTFAARLGDDERTVSTLFYLPPPPGAAFLEALTTKIEEFLATGKPPYPVERTVLTGGILDAALESRVRGHVRIETPDLNMEYDPPRESGYARNPY